MGALTSNRKRADECFSLCSPSPLIHSSKRQYYYCNNQIDTHTAKKPRTSYFYAYEKVIFTPQSSASRLRRYPEPEKLRREVHAPCRLNRVRFWSSGLKRENSGIREKKSIMGNTLRRGYEKAKTNAFDALRYFKVDKNEEVIDLDAEPQKEDGILKDWGEVEIVEGGNEVRSVVSDDHRAVGSDGLQLEPEKLGRKVVHNDAIEEDLAVSNWTKVEDAGKDPGLRVLDREAYEELLSRVNRKYTPNLSSLDFEIKSYEARWQSLRSLHKPKEKRKPEELKKPREDLLRELFVPLTEEEERDVRRALSNSNRRKILVTHENSNIEITGEILQCLNPGLWLNDEVINVYLELLKERERREPKKFLNCHFFNTFFYKKVGDFLI
ncbi:Ubiquitin-like-specific protease ESD4, partial [Bienertia sinuspersici]